MKKCIRIFSIVCFFVVSAIMMLLMIGYARIPDVMTVSEYDKISTSKNYVCVNNQTEKLNNEYETSVKLFNIFPIKNAKVTVTQRKYVVPGGNVFGIRLYTKGVMVIRIDEVTTPSGNKSPGKAAGLKEGDIVYTPQVQAAQSSTSPFGAMGTMPGGMSGGMPGGMSGSMPQGAMGANRQSGMSTNRQGGMR